MKKIIAVVLFFTGLFSYGQNKVEIEKLLWELSASKPDTGRVIVLNKIAWHYSSYDMDKSLSYSKQALELSDSLGFRIGMATAYNYAGIVYDVKGDFEKAFFNFNKSIEIAREIKNTKKESAALKNIGILYEKKGDYKSALEYYLQSLAIRERTKDTFGIASTLMGIGINYKNSGRLEEALSTHRRSLELFSKLNDQKGIAHAYGNIAGVYNVQHNSDSALFYLFRSISIYEKSGDQVSLVKEYSNIGNVYIDRGDAKNALEYQEKSLKIRIELNDRPGMAISYGNIGSVFMFEKKYDKAREQFEKMIALSKELEILYLEKDGYKSLGDAFAALKNFEEAHKCRLQYIALNDSVFTLENAQKINELQVKYETEKKEKENLLLNNKNQIQALQLSQRNYLVIGLIGLLLVALLIAWLLLRQNKFRSEQKSMQLEQKLLRSQMNPHFIFNSLTTIQSYIYNNEPKEAGRYLAGFAKLMRLILENSREEYISLSKEIRTLEHYLELQKLRFEENLTYHIEIEEGLDTELAGIPPMLAQPFIENSIEHGLVNSDVKGVINIRFSRKGNDLIFDLKDNGIGLQKAAELKTDAKKHKSLATVITSERLAILNKRKKEKIKVQIEEIKDPFNKVLGTHVSFSIPLREI